MKSKRWLISLGLAVVLVVALPFLFVSRRRNPAGIPLGVTIFHLR